MLITRNAERRTKTSDLNQTIVRRASKIFSRTALSLMSFTAALLYTSPVVVCLKSDDCAKPLADLSGNDQIFGLLLEGSLISLAMVYNYFGVTACYKVEKYLAKQKTLADKLIAISQIMLLMTPVTLKIGMNIANSAHPNAYQSLYAGFIPASLYGSMRILEKEWPRTKALLIDTVASFRRAYLGNSISEADQLMMFRHDHYRDELHKTLQTAQLKMEHFVRHVVARSFVPLARDYENPIEYLYSLPAAEAATTLRKNLYLAADVTGFFMAANMAFIETNYSDDPFVTAISVLYAAIIFGANIDILNPAIEAFFDICLSLMNRQPINDFFIHYTPVLTAISLPFYLIFAMTSASFAYAKSSIILGETSAHNLIYFIMLMEVIRNFTGMVNCQHSFWGSPVNSSEALHIRDDMAEHIEDLQNMNANEFSAEITNDRVRLVLDAKSFDEQQALITIAGNNDIGIKNQLSQMLFKPPRKLKIISNEDDFVQDEDEQQAQNSRVNSITSKSSLHSLNRTRYGTSDDDTDNVELTNSLRREFQRNY